MSEPLNLPTKVSCFTIRCQCGDMVGADSRDRLVELARLHFGEFHPDIGSEVPRDLIMAMAEEKEKS